MARTGVNIEIGDTILGSPPDVNGNSLLIVSGATPLSAGAMAFEMNTPYMLQSPADLALYGVTLSNNKDVFQQVSDYFQSTNGLLWLVGVVSLEDVLSEQGTVTDFVRRTVRNGFEFRPRNLLFSKDVQDENPEELTQIQQEIDLLYAEGFATVAIASGGWSKMPLPEYYTQLEDLTKKDAPMVGTLMVTNRREDRPCVGLVGGFMATLSVGTSIGNASFPPLGSKFYFVDGDGANGYTNTPVSNVSLSVVNTLGDKGYIFTRTRPPRNGLWLNDGATANDATMALSTLEAGRTIASIVDDTRTFFTSFINNSVPVTRTGDISPTYKSVVMRDANAKIITPYKERGDISDARLTLRAKDGNFIETRTWEVTLEILDAATLRWVEARVFYVKAIN